MLIVIGTLRSLDLPCQLTTSALVLLAVNLAALIPGLPANFGPFEASAIMALKTAHVATPQALGFVLVYHLLHTVPVTILGAPDLRSRWRFVAPESSAATNQREAA